MNNSLSVLHMNDILRQISLGSQLPVVVSLVSSCAVTITALTAKINSNLRHRLSKTSEKKQMKYEEGRLALYPLWFL